MRTLRRKALAWSGFLLAWHLAAVAADTSFLPTPLASAAALIAVVTSDVFPGAVAVTTVRVALAALIVVVAGAAFVFASRRSVVVRAVQKDLLFPLTHLVPTIIWIFIILALVGISPLSTVLIVAIATFPYFVINFEEGVTQLDRDLLEVGAVFGRDDTSVFRHITLPLLYPHLLSAFRSLVGLAWKVVVLAEVFAATRGIGYQLQAAQQVYDMPAVIAWGVVIIAIVALTDGLFRLFDARLLRQHLETDV